MSEAISLPNEPDDVNLTEALKMDFYRAQALKDQGPGSPLCIEYGLKLRDYGINTLMKQWRCDELWILIREKTNICLPPLPSWWTVANIRSIVGVSVSGAVDPFLERAIMLDGWDPRRGATIPIYFVGKCYYAFADEYRREYRAERNALQDLQGQQGQQGRINLDLDVLKYVQQAASPGPEPIVVSRDEIRRLLKRAHPRTREIVFLIGTGMSYREIADRLQMTADGVRSALRVFRATAERAHRGAR